ncbi:MAG: hypothetical protein ABL903_15260 [Methylococcales bacterium]
MKTINVLATALVMLMMMSMPGYAVDTQNPQPATDTKGAMGKMTSELLDQHLRAKQEHLLKMHELSNQILTEQDAAKKEQLKTQQLELMKADHAKMMEHHHGKRNKH